MLNKMRNRQGFTLIELLIVVAIIGILAAVAIPQFSAYRMRGFNSASSADTRNAKTAQESLFADNQTYGMSNASGVIPVPVPTNTGGGAFIAGPQPAATATIVGAYFSGPDNTPAPNTRGVAVGFTLSNNVTLVANSALPVAPATTSGGYLLATKHLHGDTVYATEALGTSYFSCTNETFVRAANLGAAVIPALPAPYNSAVLTNALACGGSPIANWTQK